MGQLVRHDGGFELRFQHLHRDGRALSFPCDESGQVNIDGLSEMGRVNYMAARALIGRDYSLPVVTPPHPPQPQPQFERERARG